MQTIVHEQHGRKRWLVSISLGCLQQWAVQTSRRRPHLGDCHSCVVMQMASQPSTARQVALQAVTVVSGRSSPIFTAPLYGPWQFIPGSRFHTTGIAGGGGGGLGGPGGGTTGGGGCNGLGIGCGEDGDRTGGTLGESAGINECWNSADKRSPPREGSSCFESELDWYKYHSRMTSIPAAAKNIMSTALMAGNQLPLQTADGSLTSSQSASEFSSSSASARRPGTSLLARIRAFLERWVREC